MNSYFSVPAIKFWTWGGLAVFSAAVFVILADTPEVFYALLFLFLFFWFAARPMHGILLMIVLVPFVEWQYVFGSFNVPVGDLVAVIAFVSFMFRQVFLQKEIISMRSFFRMSLPFFIFFLALLPSFVHAPDIAVSLKYFLRPIVFFYLMFVCLPASAIHSRKDLWMCGWAVVVSGVIASLSSLAMSFFAQGQHEWWRIVPPQVYGFAPYGINHNVIAELLVATIPVTVWMMFSARNLNARRFLFLSSVLQIAVLLATFSRAGWISLVAVLMLYLGFRGMLTLRFIARALAGMIPFGLLMYWFSMTSVVSDSNANRLLLSEIAISAWKQSPLIGNGLSTFTSFVAQNTVYVVEYGSAMEAHGVLVKLLPETGVLGAAGFLILFLALFVYFVQNTFLSRSDDAKRSDRLAAFAFFSSFFGVMIFQFFNTSYFLGKTWLFLGLALAAVSFVHSEFKPEPQRR